MSRSKTKSPTPIYAVIMIALALVLIWLLFDLVLITTGAILIAILLRLGAEPLSDYLRLPKSWALFFSGLMIVSLLGGLAYLFGTEINVGLQEVIRRAAEAQKNIMATLQTSELGKTLLAHFNGSVPLTEIAGRIFGVSASFLAGFVVTVFAGIYFAAQPSLYRRGLSTLVPPEWRDRTNSTIDCVADALRLWLFGQLIQMVLIGLLSTFAVWLVGLPSPFIFGLIAGIAEFVPYLGPIVAAIPAILVAATVSLSTVLWTTFAYALIHQAEGQLIAPLIQQRMVFIPPALMLLSIVMLGILFGPTSIFLAAPITVILFVVTAKAYVRDSLGEKTTVPGEVKDRESSRIGRVEESSRKLHEDAVSPPHDDF